MDRRRLRSVRTREQLTEHALALFEKQSFEDTTVDDIVSAAQVSARTFFHHFPSKEAVLFDGYADRIGVAVDHFRDRSQRGSLWSALADACETVVQAFERQPELFLRRAHLYEMSPLLRAAMLAINEEWIDAMTTAVAAELGLDPRSDLRPRLVATVVNSANRAAIELWRSSLGTVSLRHASGEALKLVKPTIDKVERHANAGK